MKAELESLDRLTAFKEAEEKRLRELVSEYQRRIEAVPGIESEWVALTRDYETLEQNYRSLLTKSEASKVSLDLESRQISEHFRIVDPARRPVKPVSPDPVPNHGSRACERSAVWPAVVVLLELKDAAFRTESEVVRLLSLPVLALSRMSRRPVNKNVDCNVNGSWRRPAWCCWGRRIRLLDDAAVDRGGLRISVSRIDEALRRAAVNQDTASPPTPRSQAHFVSAWPELLRLPPVESRFARVTEAPVESPRILTVRLLRCSPC